MIRKLLILAFLLFLPSTSSAGGPEIFTTVGDVNQGILHNYSPVSAPSDSDTYSLPYTPALAAIAPTMFSGTTPLVKTWSFVKGLNNDVQVFVKDKLVIYNKGVPWGISQKLVPYVGLSPVIGGYFRFDPSAAATASFRIDTVGAIPWILDGKEVASGAFASVNKDTTRNFAIGVTDPNVVNVYFYNTNYTTNKVIFDLASLSSMRPTSTLYLLSIPFLTGDLASLSSMRPKVNLELYNIPLVTGDLASLTSMRPTGNLYLYNMPLVTQCSTTTALFSLSTNINISGCGVNQTGIDNIIAAVSAGGKSNGTLQLQGGTNAVPSAAGLAGIVTLTGRGWTVTHN